MKPIFNTSYGKICGTWRSNVLITHKMRKCSESIYDSEVSISDVLNS